MKKLLFIIIPILLYASASGYAIEGEISGGIYYPNNFYELKVPALKGRVNDYGNMISQGTRSYLEKKLKDFEISDSTQVVILTVEALGREDFIEDFTIKVAEKWKIGYKGKDNGVIFFVSKKNKKIRIEVGRGLEVALTDLMAGRIVDNVISPQFKAGNFDEGFTLGIEAIIQACRGEFKNDQTDASNSTEDIILTIILIIILILFVVSPTARGIILYIIFTAALGGGGGGGSSRGGGFSGGGGSFGGGGASGRW